ncbi:MAG: hypothetical protein GWO40_16035, partial [Gammaproteobacteria bacterium]|nr:hypothetical protein [Gammaproteobacteria bacterium]NIV52883.1 hypothetical protein [Gammaproteobacteria bacterium]NIX87040.1 hypothetical protein [Gammaproteobacteria bacterium]
CEQAPSAGIGFCPQFALDELELEEGVVNLGRALAESKRDLLYDLFF